MLGVNIKTYIIIVFVPLTIQDDSYSKVNHDIFYKELLVLPTHAFKDFPSPMGWESYIRIQSSNLSTIEPEALKNVRVHDVDIAHNELDVLKMGMFVNVSLRTFFLDNNKIKSIQTGTFDDIHPYDDNGAFKLSLATNRLESISKGIFNLLKVNTLYLQKNLIKFIEKGSFNNMPKLKRLCVANNMLETIDIGIFQNLGDNIYLELENNKITFVDKHAFENNTQLHLYLKGNQVDMIKAYFTNSNIVKFVV